MQRVFKTLFLLFFGILPAALWAQTKHKHFISFTDKAGTPFSISKPEQFLSEAAIKRRQRQHISVKTRDLPVNPNYVAGIKNLGVEVLYKSKWFNGAVILCDSAKLSQVQALPFVKKAETVNRFKAPEFQPEEPIVMNDSEFRTSANRQEYGISFAQAEQIGATQMHDAGFHGEGMTIAVFDAGFPGVNVASPFAHLYQNNQLKGAYNFVENTSDVYRLSSHGTQTLSDMGAYKPGLFIGTAYKANYFLFITEDARTPIEQFIEEYNWLAAAEYSDSAGVDVINSSLGYSYGFGFPSRDYTYAEMDGNTAISTRAADFAAATGMLVVSSAGNEGDDPWRFVTAPADADSVLTVGAVDSTGFLARFSSVGPTADQRIKPNLVAQGFLAATVLPDGQVTKTNGTSFSGPILAGMATGFWQANPHLTNMQVIDLLQRSATRANNPNTDVGYGIPNFTKALNLTLKEQGIVTSLAIYPNPNSTGVISLGFEELAFAGPVDVKVYNRIGQMVDKVTLQRTVGQKLTFSLKSGIGPGLYFIQVAWANEVKTLRLVKLP